MSDIFENNTLLWVDPPAGWKFGFPRIYDKTKDNPDVVEWIIECGYPRKVMESYGNYFNYRMWSAEDSKSC